MAATSENNPKKHICIGLLAHVDAGKTTLSEGLLYAAGMIRQRGRVDKQDAHLDTDAMERERGITIFSKQAMLKLPEITITLLDTPGHVDFSAEMERTLHVLDYAILVISGADGVQGHTKTLWNLLKEYRIPVFLFINKMDQQGTDEKRLLAELKRELSDSCVSFSFDSQETEQFFDALAMCDEAAMEAFLETGRIEKKQIREMIFERKVFPCYFGSALKYSGVEEFLKGVCDYAITRVYPDTFGAKVFKIARDESGARLTYLKITGGSLKVRSLVSGKTTEASPDAERQKVKWEEKISQIRLYSGAKYESVLEAFAGEVCAVTGLTKTYPGEGLGGEPDAPISLLEPVLTYRILLLEDCDAMQILPKLRELEEEDPKLHLVWNETHQEILVCVMGEVQTQILKRQVFDRFGVEIDFDTGRVLYKETIENRVEGVGHFEPLRHYAEVHLLLEPMERGSGLVFETKCSEDSLEKNWQRLVLTHLREKEHIGVLTGSAITDMKITLVAGRSHPKHTEGGDFRQAVYRAVRQGLKQAKSILLEPYYQYRLEVPEGLIGRAMTDLELRNAAMEAPEILDGVARICGRAPVSALQEYAKEVASYAKGDGRLSLSYGGYDVCHDAEAVIAQIGYDAEADLENPSSSVFCAHGAGYVVEWDKVPEYMHIESVLRKESKESGRVDIALVKNDWEEEWLPTEEVDAILARTFDANKRNKGAPKKGYKTSRRIVAEETSRPVRRSLEKPKQEEYLLVDGYNIIYAWEDLRELSKSNMDGARGRLLDLLCNYQGMKKCHVIAVFDAYRVEGHGTECFDYHNIHVVFTKEAETADAYIEKFAHDNGKKYRITVATSDGLEQVIIRGAGCLLLSANDFLQEMRQLEQEMKETHLTAQRAGRNYPLEGVLKEVEQEMHRNAAEEEET